MSASGHDNSNGYSYELLGTLAGIGQKESSVSSGTVGNYISFMAVMLISRDHCELGYLYKVVEEAPCVAADILLYLDLSHHNKSSQGAAESCEFCTCFKVTATGLVSLLSPQ